MSGAGVESVEPALEALAEIPEIDGHGTRGIAAAYARGLCGYADV